MICSEQGKFSQVRVSGGDLCVAEAPTDAAAETILTYFKKI